MVTAIVVAVAAAAADGGTLDAGTAPRFSDPLYSECPPASTAGAAAQREDGSWVLPPARAARNACLMETCDARRQQLEVAPPPLSTTSLLFAGIAAVLALALGLYVGWEFARWLPR